MSMITEDGTRIRPLVALRALRALFRNGEDTKQVFIIGDALRGRTGLRVFNHFRTTELGREVLEGRHPPLIGTLSDSRRLAALPDGTLGRVYHDFMAVENLTADGLVDASMAAGSNVMSPEVRRFRERARDQHDLHHVTTGYGRDGLGEVCLLAFGYAQTGNRGNGVIVLAGMLKILSILPGQPIISAVWQAYRNGRKARTLLEQDWEALLDQPLEQLRAGLGIREPSIYRGITAAIRRGEIVPRLPPQQAMAA
jgi:ubiquinone biosynthesis protein COQ4